MGSPLVPIMLIVVLLVGAVVFVVLSSRSSRSSFDARSPSRQGKSKHRSASGTAPTREDGQRASQEADTLVPGLDSAPSAVAPPTAAPGATTVLGGDVTARNSTGGGRDAAGGRDTAGGKTPGKTPEPTQRRRPGDVEETKWTEPPAAPPPPTQDATTLIVPVAGRDTATPRPESGTPTPGGSGPRPVPLWDNETPGGGPPGSPSREPGGDLVADEPLETAAPALRLAAAGRTRRGKRGGPNEDAFVVADGLLAVADGVGGEAAGQIASTLAVTTVAQFRPQFASDPRDGLRRAVERANKVVREKPKEQPNWRGMACTLDVVVLGRRRETANVLTVAHVGDSSVWLQPSKGRPRKLTTPHAIKNGPLLNAVGLGDEIEADMISEPVQAGDRVVLASDGITKVMSPEALDSLMGELGTEPPERAANALVEAAMLAGARDDTTIVVADLVPDDTAR